MRVRFFLLLFISVIIVSGVLLAGCVNNPDSPETSGSPDVLITAVPDQAQPETAGVVAKSTYGEAKTVVDANNQIAFEMYNFIRQDPQNEQRNIFFSPFSMSSALAMTYEGAKGVTADEIESVFHFPKDKNTRQQQFREIDAGINKDDSGYTLRTANALWVEKTCTISSDYVKTIRGAYNADATNLDFKNSPDNSRLTINTWVENKTDGNIAELLPSGSVDPSTRLVITNAVFFNGFWKYPFFKEDTRAAKFNTSQGKSTDVNMMVDANWSLQFNYNETDQLQIVEMPYTRSTGKELSMLVILPKGDNMTPVETSLDAQNFSKLRNALQPKLVFIWLPRYKITTQYQMDPILKSMGMPDAFTGNADFSGIDGTRNLHISTVIHKAYVDVDEKGTKAAAVTAISMVEHSGYHEETREPIIFNADHPFLFIIQDRENGNILFMGRVMNPNGS
jgi:serpin B